MATNIYPNLFLKRRWQFSRIIPYQVYCCWTSMLFWRSRSNTRTVNEVSPLLNGYSSKSPKNIPKCPGITEAPRIPGVNDWISPFSNSSGSNNDIFWFGDEKESQLVSRWHYSKAKKLGMKFESLESSRNVFAFDAFPRDFSFFVDFFEDGALVNCSFPRTVKTSFCETMGITFNLRK